VETPGVVEGLRPRSAVLRYFVTAALLGAGWFVVLLLPGVTRGFLLEQPMQSIGFLVVASLVTAAVFARFIASASSFASHLVRAVVLPYAGCLVYLTLMAAAIWVRSLLTGGLANLHDTLSLYAMGFTAATVSFYVVVPYALLCQFVMHRAAAYRPEAGQPRGVGNRMSSSSRGFGRSDGT
jgi:hypothetical protein